MLGHQDGFNKIPNADMYTYKSWKKYITRYDAHVLSKILHKFVLFTLAKVIVFCKVYIIVMNTITLSIMGRY